MQKHGKKVLVKLERKSSRGGREGNINERGGRRRDDWQKEGGGDRTRNGA